VTLLPLLGVGLLLGVRHATDADHVVAVAALASREKRAPVISKLGAMWGAGHMLTVFGVGGAIIALGLVVPPRVALAFELCVGLMLIAIGAANLVGNSGKTAAPRSAARSFGVGMVHGLAGSTAIALMILATIRDVRAALAYLVVFGLGTVAGMVAVTFALSLPMMLVTRADIVQRHIGRVAGLVSVAFGFVVIWRIVAAW
jgi:high-affinity nickel-transport protein